MKKTLLLALALALPLSQAARADDHDNHNNNRSHHHAAPAVPAPQAHVQAQPQSVRNLQRPNPAYPPHRYPTATRTVPYQSVDTGRVYNRPVVTRTTANGFDANNGRFRDRNREDNGRTNNNAAARNNRSHHSYDRNSFSAAQTRVVHTHHDRGWWRSHYHTTFVLFGGGYYYFDAGYWFPAYGYDPYYDSYSYSEPIYGYNDLAPGQVLENVQLALRDAGYYHGAIDGLIGPETRAALAAYQRDNGLVITEAVDEPTLVTLGLA